MLPEVSMQWGIDYPTKRLYVQINGDSTPEERLVMWEEIHRRMPKGGSIVISFGSNIIPLSIIGLNKLGHFALDRKVRKIAVTIKDDVGADYLVAAIKVMGIHKVAVRSFTLGQEMFDWLNEEVCDE
jgi:hypothetical protein